MKRVIIGGTGSGCGKTTVTCAILSALKQREMSVSSFKCGPDYIDPMFHRRLLGTDSHNLDSFFCNKDTICSLLERYGSSSDIAVIEGVMGYYDGSSGSAHSLSLMTDTTAVITVNCKGMSDSIGAVMKGFLTYRSPNNIAGFIFNMLPEKLIPFAKELCAELGTEYFGCLPKNTFTIESRHLGLVTADEIADIDDQLRELGALAEKYILLDKLLALPENPVPQYKSYTVKPLKDAPVIAIARDAAFCFQYPENLDILTDMGCKLRFFSPLSDGHLPPADGIILCGGYPELYADKLEKNSVMRFELYMLLNDGIPFIAECGGFMYLHDAIKDSAGTAYSMVGYFDGKAFPRERLTRFGYVTMTAHEDTVLCPEGGSIKAHEFHYWDSSNRGNSFTAVKNNGTKWECGHSDMHCYAGFPHLYFPSDIGIPRRFVQACIDYRNKKEKK
ncbi:cobyrinate a,c-diamide synthase [Ruminococcus sp. XPD3002]|uniref:cobyrinate a,c-diamide synthase n=1 Tax=Ruminococcus sp. XPD3002 TaxID=1452269 RepID=UPI0009248267|nr:cobyrinic acid a,c-diamide synthase [Ruminococcus flavefaciens]